MEEEYNKKHWTPEGFNIDGSTRYKVKRSFETEIKAQSICFQLNLKPETIHKLVAYKCPVCNKWHIGHHSNKTLDEKAKLKIQKQYNEWKIIHKIK